MKHICGPQSRSSLSNVQSGDVQPNAVDLRLDRVFEISNKEFIIDEERKVHRGTTELFPDEEGYFVLKPGSYEVVMENIISVGEHEAGWVITRSTLNRNDIFITSGLYDSKYNGAMAGCMHVGSGVAKIKKGTRVGQYLSFDAEMLYGYNGDYGFNADGTAKAMEAKYHK